MRSRGEGQGEDDLTAQDKAEVEALLKAYAELLVKVTRIDSRMDFLEKAFKGHEHDTRDGNIKMDLGYL